MKRVPWSIWIPCLLGAFALAMLVFAWRSPKRPAFAEVRTEEAERRHSESLARVRSEIAERDSILRPIHEELGRGSKPEWSGEYLDHKAGVGGNGHCLLLGTTSYAWLLFSDIHLDSSSDTDSLPDSEPELWPRATIEEHGRASFAGARVHLQPVGEVAEWVPHELEWARDAYGTYVTEIGGVRRFRFLSSR